MPVQLASSKRMLQDRLQCKHLLWRLHLGDLPLNHDDVMHMPCSRPLDTAVAAPFIDSTTWVFLEV